MLGIELLDVKIAKEKVLGRELAADETIRLYVKDHLQPEKQPEIRELKKGLSKLSQENSLKNLTNKGKLRTF